MKQAKDMTANERIRSARRCARPFVKWVGGKTQLIPSISAALPDALFKASGFTYIEPFVGGGAVLFRMLENVRNIRKAVINDVNPDLTTAYLTVRNDVSGLIAQLKEIQEEYRSLRSEESRKTFFLSMRERYNTKACDPVTNTALFIFLNRTCFNGLYRVNRKGLFNVPFGKYAHPTVCDEETLLADSALLQKVEILTGDFEQTLNCATQPSFFYFDPPYKPLSRTAAFTSYAQGHFDDAEQVRLKRFCDRLDGLGYWWLLSNSDVRAHDPRNDFFDTLYAAYSVDRVWASRAVNSNPGKRGKLTELLIRNYTRGL